MEKDLKVAELSDYYKGLLTERQYDIVDRYYNLDCSLAEIAEYLGITRQSVRDALVKSRDALFSYESRLHLREKHAQICALVEEGLTACEEPQAREYLKRIRKVIEG